ncbi:MAG: F0F1 ATP synthase subunit alpha [Gammaproteobacteria bacterium]|nr:F0F1 ATP synthase subunit alpha [Gammaproteobacteria bacterium]
MEDDPILPPTGPLRRQAAWLERYDPPLRLTEEGRVISVGDGIAWVSGLPSTAMDGVLDFADGSRGMVFDLSEGRIGTVLLHQTAALAVGTAGRSPRGTLRIAVSNDLPGRVIDPLGAPLDGVAACEPAAWYPLKAKSPPITARDFVHKPLYSGIAIIDTLIPIGKGQRQLVIGDEGLGRSSVALDAVINQRGKGVCCVYVLIGQKRSAVVNTIQTLRQYQALEFTTVVVAEASALPGLQYLAPFAGCAIAEFWMRQGRDTLVVYDDLATHAKTYRELSLLLRRPPGREAYPGDIFSVHAELLERATCLNAAAGGGSMTALPIVETLQGEIAAYIPTNLISITDGQIYLDRNLFAGGFRPAIDVARSVSRIGGQAQHPRIKEEAGRMKLDYLQFLELEVFTRFGARLEASMEAAIQRGRTLREILKQDRLSPQSIEYQMAWLVAFNEGLFADTPVENIAVCLRALMGRMEHTDLSLDSPREAWVASVTQWLRQTGLGGVHEQAT